MAQAYDELAEVYDWLVPESLTTPAGAAAAFADVLAELPEGARVLDCAAGTGLVAVGLALEGLDVTATDASPEMIGRAAALAERHGVALAAEVCSWERLPARGWAESFDAVLCVGNSLTHAPGRAARRTALAAMASVLRPGGLLVVTSRNWEVVRAAGTRLEIDREVVRRGAAQAVIVRAWTVPESWDDEHVMEVAVARLLPGDTVSAAGERLTFWPFRHEALDSDLESVHLAPESSTFAGPADRYLVTARKPGQPASGRAAQ